MKPTLLICLLFWNLVSLKSQPLFTTVLAEKEAKQFETLRSYDLHSVSSTNYDINYYRCEWTVDPAVRFISGSVTSYFTILSQSNSIVFDMSNALAVDSILYHGKKTTFIQTINDGLQVNFPASIAANQKDSVSIFYKGAPPNTGFGSFNTTTHSGMPVLWTLSEPYGAPTWWPCKDITTDKADSIDIIITNPATYTSSSNGMNVKEVVNGNNRTTYWKHRYPIATYLVAIAVTNYTIVNDLVQLPSRQMPVILHSYPETLSSFRIAIDIAKFCLQGFSSRFIEYPFSAEKYAQTQFSWGGGMEHQTNSFITSSGAGLVAHELSHQWFGDKITCGSWHDIWLNEGFATYMEYIYVELSSPSSRFSMLQGLNNYITSQPGGSVYVPDTTNINRIFDGRLTYDKGGYLLHMLRWKLGDSAFFRGVRRYLMDPLLAYRHAYTADLKRNLEVESNQDLTKFFNQWYYGEGYPNYHATWTQQGSNVVRLELDQTTSTSTVPFFEMPVPLEFKSATRDTILVVNHTANNQVFTLNPGFTADSIIIDPQLWILSRNKTSNKVSIASSTSDLVVFPNPVKGEFSISYPNNYPGLQVRIFNATGQLVYSEKPATGNVSSTIDASQWAAGVYLLTISANGIQETRRFEVLRK
jgi:aminopeptidase N